MEPSTGQAERGGGGHEHRGGRSGAQWLVSGTISVYKNDG